MAGHDRADLEGLDAGLLEGKQRGDAGDVLVGLEQDLAAAGVDDVCGQHAAVAAKAEAIQAEIDADYGAVFAQTEVDLKGEKADVRTGETNLGDLITDAMLWQANTLGEPVDAAVTNGGGIRST